MKGENLRVGQKLITKVSREIITLIYDEHYILGFQDGGGCYTTIMSCTKTAYYIKTNK